MLIDWIDRVHANGGSSPLFIEDQGAIMHRRDQGYALTANTVIFRILLKVRFPTDI